MSEWGAMANHVKHPILLVDDNRNSFAAGPLTEFQLFTATSGRRASIEILGQQPIEVLMTDQRMPEMTGVELVKTVQETLSRCHSHPVHRLCRYQGCHSVRQSGRPVSVYHQAMGSGRPGGSLAAGGGYLGAAIERKQLLFDASGHLRQGQQLIEQFCRDSTVDTARGHAFVAKSEALHERLTRALSR